MTVKRKISVRKIIQALLTIVLAGVCITAVSSATRLHKTRTVADVQILIENDKYGFVTEEDIRDVLREEEGIEEKKTKVSELSVKNIEERLVNNPWVDNAEVYIDNQSKLHALVTQRVPTVRIFEKTGNSYYLDKRNNALATSGKYNYYTMVVTNVPELSDDSASIVLKEKITTITNFIRRDEFWNAQVSQVIVMDDRRFELVPVLGEHRIIIGDTTDLKKKFDNLMLFYKKVLNNIGWDRYELLDLSYKGQLVASPAINWNLPEDKTIKRINWVESILGEPVYYQTFNKPLPTPEKPNVTNIDTLSTNDEEVKTEQAASSTQQELQVNEQEQNEAVKEVAPVEEAQPETPKENKPKKKQPKYIYGGD